MGPEPSANVTGMHVHLDQLARFSANHLPIARALASRVGYVAMKLNQVTQKVVQ